MHIEIFRQQGKTAAALKQPWRWHFRNKGRIVADAEAFPTKAHAVRAAKAVVRAAAKRAAKAPLTFELLEQTPRTKANVFILTWRVDNA